VGESSPNNFDEYFPNGIPKLSGVQRSKSKSSARKIPLQREDLTSLQIIFFLSYIQ
jgi:hypothetical protein